MKIVFFILGLGLLSAGIYYTSTAFAQFTSLDPQTFGLMIGGAFIAMSLGSYLMLLLFNRKTPKVIEPQLYEGDKDLFDSNLEEPEEFESEETDLESTPVEALEETKIIKLESLQEAHPIETKKPSPSAHETLILDLFKPTEENETAEVSEQDLILEEETTQTLKNFFGDQSEDENDDLEGIESMEARLIGIETWSIQRVLKKIPEDAQVFLKMNSKHGLRMAEIFYENKSIGYLSKVDYNKMEDKLPRLRSIHVSTIVSEHKAIDTVILRFTFNPY